MLYNVPLLSAMLHQCWHTLDAKSAIGFREVSYRISLVPYARFDSGVDQKIATPSKAEDWTVVVSLFPEDHAEYLS